MNGKRGRISNPDGRQDGTASAALERRLAAVEEAIAVVVRLLRNGAESGKEWYSTTELAAAMGVTVYTVSCRWCTTGRIEAVKDRHSGRWKIPGREYQRLVRGGGLRPKAG